VPALTPFAGLVIRERADRQGAIDQVLAEWFRPQQAAGVEIRLLQAGIPAAALATSLDLVSRGHLQERGFWEPRDGGALPGLPWRASFGRASGPAPELGADTEVILKDVLGLSRDEIASLRASGALG
jgi:crotonobetainyl-CoA:carnitine CoA-transferase CaiB-like acyl-CoA transferase